MAKTDVCSVRFTNEDHELIKTIADGRPIGQVIRACVVAILTELQRQRTSHRDEFAEFDTTETEFDAMLAHSEPARLVLDRQHRDNPGAGPLDTIRSLIDDVTQNKFTVPPVDLTITIHREQGRWWAELPTDGEAWYVGAETFDRLTERIIEGLHLLGLNQERTTITWNQFPGVHFGSINTSVPKQLTCVVPAGE